MRYLEIGNGSGVLGPSNDTFLNSSINKMHGMRGSGVDDRVCPTEAVKYPDFTQIHSVYVTLITFYVLVITLAICGNTLVIYTIWRNKSMHTVTNYYIVNLALSDLLVSLFVMPLVLMEYTVPCHWMIFSNDALCAILYYTLPIFVFASILTLVAISLERYYAIVHPLSAMKVNSKSRTRKILAVTWIIPMIVCTPYLYCQSQAVTLGSEFGTISRQYCTDRFNELDNDTGLFRKCFFGLLFMIMYFVPMVVIIITCTRIAISLLKPIMDEQFPRGNRDNKRRSEMNKRKVARMVIVVAIAFIIAWSPQFIISMISQLQTESFLQESNFFFTMLIIHFFGFMNSCMNPFIYTAMSEKFRNSFRETLSRLFCYLCGRHTTRADYNGHSTTLMSNTTRTFQETEVEPLQHSGDGERLRVMYTTRKGSDVSYGSASYMNKHIPGEN